MKKFMVCLGILVLILVCGGMARATQVTFNFNPPALPDNSNAAAIGTYMTGLYGSAVTVAGHNGPVSETGLFTLLGGIGDGYIESEYNRLRGGGEDSIVIKFVNPITSVSFDWATYFDAFNADYSINGTTGFTNFFNDGLGGLGEIVFLNGGHFATYTFSSPVLALAFHDDGYGEVGIDNLVVNSVPEPATMLLLGSGLVGLAGFARRRYKKNS